MRDPNGLAVKLVAGAAIMATSYSVACGATLPRGITEFDGTGFETVQDDLDLKPLGDIVGRARVVGLGESIHTSGGFHDAKFRLIRYLVERHGFRVFAMETPRLQAQPAVDYLTSCSGSPMNAVGSIFGVFASTSTRDLFQWLCEFNGSHPSDPVKFVAFDMQEPKEQMHSITDFLSSAVPADAPSLTNGLGGCNGISGGSTILDPVSEASRTACLAAVTKVLRYLDAHEHELELSSPSTLTLVRLSLTGLAAWEDQSYYYSAGEIDLSYNARDHEMAKALMTLRQNFFPTAKTFIWAHNYHIEKAGDQDAAFGIALKNMGQYLAEAWRGDYVSLGLVSYETNINWPMSRTRPRCQDLPPPTASNAVEVMLHGLGRPFLIVDLDSMHRNRQPFFDPDVIYQYDPIGDVSESRVVRQFNGLVYLDHSAAMESPYWGDCEPGSSGFSPLDPGAATPTTPLNLGFEQCSGDGTLPLGWTQLSGDYPVACSPSEQTEGRWGIHITATGPQDSFGGVSQCMAIQNVNGTIDFSGFLRLINVSSGFAGLWMNVVNAAGESVAFDNMQSRGIRGTRDWARYQIRLFVPDGAVGVCFGALLAGDGEIGVEDLKMVISPSL